MDQIQRKPGVFNDELSQMKEVFQKITQEYQKISNEHYLKGVYAEWHINGLMYHAQTIIKEYSAISEELLSRLNTVKFAHVFIMHTPQMQNLMYEFYAFISLARITLDNLKHILYPLFKNPQNQMPKSITDLESGKTNCDIYERIAQTPEILYLIDLRNCLVHYRTFAINNNSVITLEGAEDIEKVGVEKWTKPMAKGTFRITENMDVVFNVFLPDIIFERNNNKKLADFTYNNRINILAETMRFLRHILFNYMDSFSQNIHSQEKRFIYEKKGGITPVEFKMIRF
jgi:hypothetical protein